MAKMVVNEKKSGYLVPKSGTRKPDLNGYHYVTGFDGTKLRFRLLGGGPRGDHSFDSGLRTAICLHGIGDSLSWWEDAVFRTQELPEDYVPSGGSAAAANQPSAGFTSTDVRRTKFVNALARRMNVVMVDLRGFGGSGRPRTVGPLKDENVTSFTTWKVQDGEGFTRAIKAELACSRAAGAASHSISVSGSTALVRISFRGVVALGMYLAKLGSLEQLDQVDAHCALQSRELMAPAARIAEFQKLLPLQAEHLNNCEASFANDAEGLISAQDQVLVIHRVKLDGEELKAAAASDRFLQEIKDIDGSCISCSIACRQGYMIAHGVFQGAEAAIAHLQRFQQWLAREDEGWSLSLMCKTVTVQVHARPPLLKTLRAVPELRESAQFFQIFPLSFEDTEATEETSTIHDFVEDVESIRRYAGANRATIVGHSMGSAIALQYAITYPERVERICVSAAAPRVGRAAYENWMQIAGTAHAWNQNVIRDTVAVVNLEDKKLQQFDSPTLLINANDDALTPVIGSEMLRSSLQTSLLYVADFGGHDCLVANNAAMERLVRFLVADDAMLFAEDPLFAEQLVSCWNLPGDKAFMRYYSCGRALAEVERVERRLRLVQNWARDRELQDNMLSKQSSRLEAGEVAMRGQERLAHGNAERKAMTRVLTRLGLASSSSDMTPKEVLMTEMMETLKRMSAPAKEAVERSGIWWRDSGVAHGAGDGSKYTVDAWGRRRGGSKHGCCAWYHWDLGSVPLSIRAGLTSGHPPRGLSSELFACWWCGGPPAAHEDLGPAGEKEEMGFFPGLGPGREPFRPHPLGLDMPIREASEGEEEIPIGGQLPKFNRISLSECAQLQPVLAK